MTLVLRLAGLCSRELAAGVGLEKWAAGPGDPPALPSPGGTSVVMAPLMSQVEAFITCVA